MDWKRYYNEELESPEGQKFVRRCLDRYPQGDPELAQILENGIISFPHTSIYYAGEQLARLIATLYRRGAKKLIALGVLHGGSLPERYRELYNEFRRISSSEAGSGSARAREVFEVFKGAFIKRSPVQTPYGEIPSLVPRAFSAVVREDEELLANEFSLDAFLTLLAFYAHEKGLDPLPTLPLFVGLTRGPGGGFTVATQLAQWLKGIVDEDTAIVATGDLVHYGTAYSSPEEMAGKPEGLPELQAFFLQRVREALERACQGDYEAFYRAATELKDDQREIVPVICEYLGKGAGYEILQFELSDYSSILGVEPPCVVASTLLGFTPP